MNNTPFYFELHDLITQFITAFDSIVIKRFDKDRVVKDKLQVRYVYSPKQRAIHDIINPAQTITLPVIAVSYNSIVRDSSRVFNKILGSMHPTSSVANKMMLTSDYIPPAVPVNVGVSMSILTKYQSDMDQIITNFVPYNNPYIILSWKVPTGLNISPPQEIRSEVLWSENIAMEYPDDLSEKQNIRFIGNTNFIIKGWLFPYKDVNDTGANIFYIHNNFTSLSALE